MAALFPKVWEENVMYFAWTERIRLPVFHLLFWRCYKHKYTEVQIHEYLRSNKDFPLALILFELSSAEATLRHCERLSALVDLQRVSASERVQEGGAFRGLPRTGHAAGHPAGHPMCLWHCQGGQAACHHHHKGEYQLKALTGLQSHQHLSFVLMYTAFLMSLLFLWYMHALFCFLFFLRINIDNI